MEVRDGGGPLDAGPHAVFVVLDHIDDGNIPQRGHVEGFVNLPLVDGTVAEIGKADAVGAVVFLREGNSGADRPLRADDAVTTVEVLLLSAPMHGATLPLGITSLASQQPSPNSGA